MNKRIIQLLSAVILTALLMACGGKTDTSALEQTIDSLRQVNQQQQSSLQEMTTFVTTLSDGMNAIAQQENMIFNNGGNEGTSLDKEQLKSHLETLANTLTEQRSKIHSLADSLKARGADMSKMQGLIDNLTQQLDEKDKIIAQLRKDIEQKNFSISDLQNKLRVAMAGSAQYEQRAAKAEKELATITTAYVLMGTKEALTDGGYIDKRKHVLTESMPKGDFTKVNIYKFTELDIPSRSPKLLTDHPRKSYNIEKVDKENRKLVITNPQLFWSSSKYLIIQVK
jgi:chromosome segregation ATPase